MPRWAGYAVGIAAVLGAILLAIILVGKIS
jgi:hypothetical protein